MEGRKDYISYRCLQKSQQLEEYAQLWNMLAYAVQELLENVEKYLTDVEVATNLRQLDRECQEEVEKSQPLRRRL
jgi:uncharacterized membrane protein YgaE (UPF0421/DUF939 family)